MGAPAVLPQLIVFPPGVTHMASGEVASLLRVRPRTVAQWERDGLLTASARTSGGHRRFTQTDVSAFVQQVCPAGELSAGDIVCRRDWNSGRPLRVTAVTLLPRWGVYLRWQDVAARQYAISLRVGRSKLVRRLAHHDHLGVA